jgi:hypothetical protein
MPMARLAEYMLDLAALLGHPGEVHFVRLDPGSTVLVHKIEDEALPKVHERVASLKRNDAPAEAIKAYRALNAKLAEDNGDAVLTEDETAEIIEFPGVREPKPITFGAFNQDGSLEGVLIKVGGQGDPARVHLQQQQGDVLICQARRELIQALGHFMYAPVRVSGSGRWHRDAAGKWCLDRFTITDFKVLDKARLSEVIERLRSVPGSNWANYKDPLEELRWIREGPDEG